MQKYKIYIELKNGKCAQIWGDAVPDGIDLDFDILDENETLETDEDNRDTFAHLRVYL